MNHPAPSLIGRPYAPNFRCWDLVRLVFVDWFGVHMPEHAAGVLHLKAAAEASGWRRAEAPAAPDDIVLMRNARGDRHVGVVIKADGEVGVLHNDGYLMPNGQPVGGVVFNTFRELERIGCKDFEFWRRS